MVFMVTASEDIGSQCSVQFFIYKVIVERIYFIISRPGEGLRSFQTHFLSLDLSAAHSVQTLRKTSLKVNSVSFLSLSTTPIWCCGLPKNVKNHLPFLDE